MESSHVTGGSEGCNSSESGWTKYLSSAMHDDSKDMNNSNGYKEDEDEYDSMASDASSGPAKCHTEESFFKQGKESGSKKKNKMDPKEEEEERNKKNKRRDLNKEGRSATSFHGSSDNTIRKMKT